MAFVSQGWYLVMAFVDSGGNVTTRRVNLVATDDDGDLAPVIADVQTIVAAYVAATDSVLVSQIVAQTNVEDSVVLPAGNINIEDNLQITAKIFGTPNKSATIEIPAPKNAMFAAPTGVGHNTALFSNALLANVVNLYKDGAQAKVSDGEVITDQNIKGKRVHHKSTKG